MKIGTSRRQAPPAPAAGTPAAPAEPAKPGASARAAPPPIPARRCERDGRALQHGVDAALERRQRRVRCREGRPHRRQIADGSFKVNPEAIADKLIANAQELLSKVTA